MTLGSSQVDDATKAVPLDIAAAFRRHRGAR
jgi:hypothetical protein